MPKRQPPRSAGTSRRPRISATLWPPAGNPKPPGGVRVAAGASFGSGLPFQYGGTRDEALAQYGHEVVSRLNFARGRILPQLAVSASLSAEIFRRDHLRSTLHIDGENLNNRLNVLDFGGLFSGNAVAPARSVMMRWETQF